MGCEGSCCNLREENNREKYDIYIYIYIERERERECFQKKGEVGIKISF
jgi:hypothetical protein